MNSSKTLRFAVIGAMLLALAGCAGAPTSHAAPASPATPASFPRTIDVPAGDTAKATSIEIAAKPIRIAALTYETAELVAALGASDSLVMVPKSVENPALSNHPDAWGNVENFAPTESATNAEAVIAAAPDLVLLSARYGLDEKVGSVLTAAGLTVLVLPNSWASVDDMTTNIDLVGEAIGADNEAAALLKTIRSGLTATASETKAPRILVLSNQAGRPFVTAGKAFPIELVRLAGGVDASADLGIAHTGPITTEQVIQAAPDAILLIDMNGSGHELFDPVMQNAAVAALPAVADGRVLLLTGNQVQALGLEHTVTGLEQIVDWLAP